MPRIYAKDISYLLNKTAKLEVERINKTAPMQFWLLCKFEAKWKKGFEAFKDNEFKEYQKSNQ